LPEDGILFVSDLIMRPDDQELTFVPFEYHEDPAATRHSLSGLLSLPFEILCLDHGAPIAHRPKEALEQLLSRTE
jgi:glyoxylase-like metal-dependent hydrolase (beta-lactamase superfamily II)